MRFPPHIVNWIATVLRRKLPLYGLWFFTQALPYHKLRLMNVITYHISATDDTACSCRRLTRDGSLAKSKSLTEYAEENECTLCGVAIVLSTYRNGGCVGEAEVNCF
jgi:hypothetical protein